MTRERRRCTGRESNARDPLNPLAPGESLPPMADCRNCGHPWAKHRASDDRCPFADVQDDRAFYMPRRE